MNKLFGRSPGAESLEEAAGARARISGELKNVMQIFKDSSADETASPALVQRAKAEDMNMGIVAAGSSVSGSNSVLMSGQLKKRDGMVVKKWTEVTVELRENSLTCFASADKAQLVDTLVIDAGMEFTLTEKDKLPALILKRAVSGSGPRAIMNKELVLGFDSEALRDRWAETLDACCLKARSHVEARKMVQDEAAARARAEAEAQRKALEDAARARAASAMPQPVHASADGTATFSLAELAESVENSADMQTANGHSVLSENTQSAASPVASDGAAAEPVPAAPDNNTVELASPSAGMDGDSVGSIGVPRTPVEAAEDKKGARSSLMKGMKAAFSSAMPNVRGDGDKAEKDEMEQLEESTNDMMMAEANRQLRQLQEDLSLEREQSAKLRDQLRQLLSGDSGAQDMLAQISEAQEEARAAKKLMEAAKAREQAAISELEALRVAATTTAERKAAEAAARDLQETQEAEEQQASQRQLVSLQAEILRLQGEIRHLQEEMGRAEKQADQRVRDAQLRTSLTDAAAVSTSIASNDATSQPQTQWIGQPASIRELCEGHGLAAYADLMEESEVGLDVVLELTDEDWKEMGVAASDLPRLHHAITWLQTGFETGKWEVHASQADAQDVLGNVRTVEEQRELEACRGEMEQLRRALIAAESTSAEAAAAATAAAGMKAELEAELTGVRAALEAARGEAAAAEAAAAASAAAVVKAELEAELTGVRAALEAARGEAVAAAGEAEATQMKASQAVAEVRGVFLSKIRSVEQELAQVHAEVGDISLATAAALQTGYAQGSNETSVTDKEVEDGQVNSISNGTHNPPEPGAIENLKMQLELRGRDYEQCEHSLKTCKADLDACQQQLDLCRSELSSLRESHNQEIERLQGECRELSDKLLMTE